MIKIVSIILFFCFFIAQTALSNTKQIEPPKQLETLKTELDSFFAPFASKVSSVQGKNVFFTIDNHTKITTGMRLLAFKEGVSFVHPVTREFIGKMEIPLGTIEVISLANNTVTATVVSGNPDEMQNALIKISHKKVKILYHQSASDWYLADAYYHMLKNSGRYELIDASADVVDKAGMIADASKKGAEIILVFESTDADGYVIAKQTLIWSADGKEFSQKQITIDSATVRALRLNAGFFAAHEGDILFSKTLNFTATRISAGKVLADSKNYLIVASGDYLRFYEIQAEMPLVYEHQIRYVNDTLWLDVIDLNANGIDEILVTSMTSRGPISEIYEFDPTTRNLKKLASMSDTFVRKLGNTIIAQSYDARDGYSGDVYALNYKNGQFYKGNSLKLPQNTGIYDFMQVFSSTGEYAYLLWDDYGYVSLVSKDFVTLWRSKDDYGGFSMAYSKESPIVMIDRGKWYVKDRFISYRGEILTIKRVPLLNVSRGAGYKSSSIKSLLWTGFAVSERDFVGEKNGEMIDFAVIDNKVIVLNKQMLVFNFLNILKGKSPLGVTINVYSTKGI